METLLPGTIFLLGISILGSMFGVLCLALYSEVDKNPKTIMAKFKLHPEKTETDFRLMLYANAGITLFLAVLSLGNAISSARLINMSYMSITLSALLVVDVVGSWVFRYA
ncbi:MAG: hypothetical protein ABEK04_01900 [Candidatus Nanohalobium sp.]